MATDIRFVPLETGTAAAAARRIAVIDPRLRRTNYFDGQLLKASDLTRDQIYLDERLLELGQAFGGGIVRGLAVSRPSAQRLRVSPGIAVAPSGRVLELSDSALDIDLTDSARLATLNDGRLSRLPRGLYVLALARAEVVDGVAEAYPRDLAAPRVPQVSAYAEGVQLVLYRLPVGLPRQDELAIRAALARELLGGHERFALPDDEAVALALLAVDGGRLQWLDEGLVRRPQRMPGTPGALQQDLAAHYAELMATVRAARSAAGLPEAFEARQYFRVLPPHGPCPKAAIDPVTGSQRFFPEAWEVAIAPVRASDLPALRSDAERLAPIDLATDADIDLMLLVPMADAAYALRARQLELPAQASAAERTGLLARLDRLALRITPLAPVHRLDTDAKVWAAIWAEAAPDELFYVRRPPRAAETGVSAIVLAAGSTLPDPVAPLPADAAKLEAELDAVAEQAEAARREAAAQQRARAAAEQQVRTLEATVAEQREALARSGDERLADALAQVAALGAELAQARAELARLGELGDTHQTIRQALTAIAADNERLRQALQAAETLVAKLKEQQAASGDTEGLQRQIQALSDKLQALSAERAKLDEALRAAQAARTLAEQQATELRSANAGLEAALQAAQGSAGDNGAALQAAEARIAGLQAELASAQATLATRSSQLDTLAEQARRLRGDYDAALAQIKTLEAGTALGVDLDKELQIGRLAALRGADVPELAARLDKVVLGEPAARLALVRLLLASDPAHDALLFASLAEVGARPAALIRLDTVVQERMAAQKLSLPRVMAEFGGDLGLSELQQRQWKAIAG